MAARARERAASATPGRKRPITSRKIDDNAVCSSRRGQQPTRASKCRACTTLEESFAWPPCLSTAFDRIMS